MFLHICENKGAVTADQRLCFHYIQSTIHLVFSYEIQRLQPSPVLELVRNHEDRFSYDAALTGLSKILGPTSTKFCVVKLLSLSCRKSGLNHSKSEWYNPK